MDPRPAPDEGVVHEGPAGLKKDRDGEEDEEGAGLFEAQGAPAEDEEGREDDESDDDGGGVDAGKRGDRGYGANEELVEPETCRGDEDEDGDLEACK